MTSDQGQKLGQSDRSLLDYRPFCLSFQLSNTADKAVGLLPCSFIRDMYIEVGQWQFWEGSPALSSLAVAVYSPTISKALTYNVDKW